MKKRIIAAAVCLALLAAFVLRAGYVLMPERMDFGSVWNQYLREPKDSLDLLVMGSSMAYCDVVPAEIYAETGLTGFVMAGPEQTFSLTYHYLREALKTQSPSVVLLEISGAAFDRYMSYSRVNVGYMPYFSIERLAATFDSVEPESRTGLLFPLYDYHDRFTGPGQLLQPRKDERVDPLAGYTLLERVQPQANRGERKITVSEEDFRENLLWLQRIRDFCDRQGIRLILFEVPSFGRIPEAWMERIRTAAGYTAEVLDLNDSFEDIGLDPETDFFDLLHTNVRGAVRVSDAIAAYLRATGTRAAHREDPALWSWRMETLAGHLAAQAEASGDEPEKNS